MCSLQGLGVFPLFSVHILLVLESSATHILSQGGAAPFQSYSNPHLPPACLPALDSRERLELSCASSKNGSHGSPQEPLSRAIFFPLSRRGGREVSFAVVIVVVPFAATAAAEEAASSIQQKIMVSTSPASPRPPHATQTKRD